MVLSRLKKVKKANFILVAVILVALGTIVTVFLGYRQVSSAPEQLLSSLKEGADLTLGKIRQTSTRDGKKEWSLEADSAHYIETENKVVLKNLFITYFLENQREVYLDADQGILQTDTNDIEFSGNVVIRNEDYRLKTRRLSYENSQRLIFSNDPVQVTGKSSELTAKSIKYDLNANKIVLTGNVAASVARDLAVFRGLDKR